MAKTKRIELSKEYLCSILDYNKDTGLFYWKKRGRGMRSTSTPAGCKHKMYGYILISINNSQYRAHRLAFVMTQGTISDDMMVDHINGVRDDNRFDNLRLVSNATNRRNCKLTKKNKSGHMGVYYNKNMRKYRAFIWNKSKEVHLGYYDTYDEAVIVRKAAEVKYDYHTNHGRVI